MTKLRLPPSLSYDEVDEMIDLEASFEVETFEIDDVRYRQHFGYRTGHRPVGNYSRPMFELLNDPSFPAEDEEGYVTWIGSGSAMNWKAQPLTEDEIDEVLDIAL